MGGLLDAPRARERHLSGAPRERRAGRARLRRPLLGREARRRMAHQPSAPGDGHRAQVGPSRRPGWAGERAVGIELKPRQRDAVLERLGISPKTSANAVTSWIALRLAHRCSRAVVCLFTTPLKGDAAICPGCRASLATSSERGVGLPHSGRRFPTAGKSGGGVFRNDQRKRTSCREVATRWGGRWFGQDAA
jgi:hypothetical protein